MPKFDRENIDVFRHVETLFPPHTNCLSRRLCSSTHSGHGGISLRHFVVGARWCGVWRDYGTHSPHVRLAYLGFGVWRVSSQHGSFQVQNLVQSAEVLSYLATR